MAGETRRPDLVIIGGGPAGLTAAIYASRAGLDAVLLESEAVGGQVLGSYSVDNYPGFRGKQGLNLVALMEEQAKELGALIEEFEGVEGVTLTDSEKVVETAGCVYRPKAVIIATGASPKRLPVPNEREYAGKGIHYCAICDGAMYGGKVVGMVGGGSSALLEAMYLAGFASRVVIIRRKGYFHGERALLRDVEANPKIEILYNRDLVSVDGVGGVESVVVRDTVTGVTERMALDAVFCYIGMEPRTSMFRGQIGLDDHGYIITDGEMATNVQGVFAVGDVRAKRYRQITTAVSDGTIAALNAQRFMHESGRGQDRW